jgi:IS605 OrfB family transposase
MLRDDPTVKPLAATGAAAGTDAGLDHRLTLSTGEKIANPRHERRDREKARRRVARIHARVTDRRGDGLHRLTTRLVRENQTLVLEDLTVRNTVRNRKLARAISDAAWAEFRSLLEYKAVWYGRDVVVVHRFFPSSKLCSPLRCLAGQDAAECPHLDVRLRNGPRPGRERGEEPSGRRAGGVRLWSWCKTSTENSGRAVGDEAENPTARAVGIPLVYGGEVRKRST